MDLAHRPVAVDDRLCLALHAAARAMDALYRPLLEALDLTYPQYLVMSVLWEQDGQTVGEIARRLSLDPSTVSPLLKRLELRQLVVRRRDPADERRVLVALSEDGEAARGCASDIPERVGAATLLEQDGQDDLVARLRTLTEALAAAASPKDS